MIRWIVEGTLGTAPYTEELHSAGKVIDVRDLADKPGNDPSALSRKIEAGIEALNEGSTVVVACDFGISRSNAIAAGILAKWRNESLDWAIEETVARTGEPSIKLDVVDAIRRAMFSVSDDSTALGILVTGATGFLGQNVVRQLSNQMPLITPTREKLNLLGAATQIERFCREQGIGQILHLAHPRIYTNNDALGESLVVLKNLIDVCRVLRIRLILPSGGVVFSGLRGENRSVHPDTEPHPKGIYGETKYLQEILVRTAVSNDEIDATVVRISPVYGPGGERPRLIRYFYQCLMEGKRIVTHVYRDETPARLDLLYIDDAVSGIGGVLKLRTNGTHHLASGKAVTPKEIAEQIAILLKRVPAFDEMPIDDFASNVLLDSTASRAALAWSPNVGLEEGLSKTVSSFGRATESIDQSVIA
jgi:nucleoside-diphosphate-sugar epimerase